jgi:nitroimidazol reductase NimA-like FMN-containing flavoprotein (pyridoxamine 5'-phosphate oxidase superfamily)
MSSRGLRILTEDECFVRLTETSVGRVSVRIGDAPAILPVNFVLLGRDVMFRTDAGSKLTQAIMGVQVAFEVDDVQPSSTPWSVVVVGYAEEVRDTTTLREIERLGLRSWAPGDRDHVVRVVTRQVSGRSLVAPPR